MCSICGEDLPIEHYYMTRRRRKNGGEVTEVSNRCKGCYCQQKKLKDAERALAEGMENDNKEGKNVKVVTCKNNCAWYPCFQGIDSMSSNLALTCNKFKKNEDTVIE